MQKIVFTETDIKQVIIHSVGNKLKEDTCLLSNQEVILGGSIMEEHFLKNTLKPIKNDEFFSFNDVKNNQMYNLIDSMMNEKSFVENSKKIAEHLFEIIDNPKTQGSQLVIVKYSNVIVDESNLCSAIGIFKLKTAEKRLVINPKSTRFEVELSTSFDLSKIDKGVMIYDYDSENGYLISVFDKHTKSDATQYWSTKFLDIVPRTDTVYFTNNALDIVERYVLEGLPEDTKKIDQINFLNNSMGYCLCNEEFDYNEFANDIFKDASDEFLEYKENYEHDYGLVSKDSFYIDKSTVERRAKKFKTIIKLDDNFDIVVKRNSTDMIMHEIDKQGRKYYKLFYNVEES